MNFLTLASWSLLVLVLFVTSFGICSLIYAIAALAVIAAGIIAGLKSHADHIARMNGGQSCLHRLEGIDFRILQGFRLPKYTEPPDPLPHHYDQINGRKNIATTSSSSSASSTVLTGHAEIDYEIRLVLHLLTRDYIESWYKWISNDLLFPRQVQDVLRSGIRVISCRIKLIDKVSYFTSKLVNDFASHLRLFRLAIEKQSDLRIEDPNPDLISLFFDHELQMEDRKVCRDVVCSNDSAFYDYITHVADVLMYLILPLECFNNRPIRLLLRSVIVNTVLQPLIDLFSDPDHINQLIIWSCQKLSSATCSSLPTESFLTIIRMTDSGEELTSVKKLLDQELTILRSRDTGGEDDFEIKQQINSLTFLDNLIAGRITKLKEGMCDSDHLLMQTDSGSDLKNFTGRLTNLPFEAVMKNNVALSHFIQFMSSIGSQGYVFFYLNVEGFRVSAELAASSGDPVDGPDLEFLRCAAVNIYDTYLSPDKYSSQKLVLEEEVVQRIVDRLRNEPISENLFDESCNQCFIVMRDRETFYPSFQKSVGYIKMLQDLDLFRENPKPDPDASLLDDASGSHPEFIEIDSLSSGPTAKPWITTEVDSTGVVREFGSAHAVYAITVSVRRENGTTNRWCSLRRYSDFFTFHSSTIVKFPTLSRLVLPAKRTLSNNMSHAFLEQRRHLLNSYLQQVIRILINRKDVTGFKEHVLKFLEPGNYNEKENASQMLGKAVDKLVFHPFKSMGDAVRTGSGNIRDKFTKLTQLTSKSIPSSSCSSTSGFARNSSLNVPQAVHKNLHASSSSGSLASNGSGVESSKVGAQLDGESEENIPLRIMLLLLDEVFDLKSRNQWLRRRIIAVIQQIIQAMSGDVINKKIVDYVEELTSPSATAEYIRTMRCKFWPKGQAAAETPVRSESTKRVTAIIAKSYLISAISDDLKHMIGSETTRKGLLRVFDMFQNKTLNRRLVIVLMEGLLAHLFPDNYFPQIFQKLHSCSSRVSSNESVRAEWPPYLAKFLSGSEPLKDTFKSPSSFYTPSTRSSPVLSVSSRGSRGSPVHCSHPNQKIRN